MSLDPRASAALSAYGSLGAAISAVIALFFTVVAAIAGHKQTKLQSQ